MSKDIYRNEPRGLIVNRFCGKNGLSMFQITMHEDFVQLNLKELTELVEDLQVALLHEKNCDEVIGVRPSCYSEWHRSLGNNLYALDIDFVEYRAGRGVVALYGITGGLNDEEHLKNSLPMIFNHSDMEFKVLRELACGIGVLRELACGIGVPAYFVVHTNDLSLFYVYTLSSNEFRVMSKEQYSSFIKGL